jgi:hypothetical protein
MSKVGSRRECRWEPEMKVICVQSIGDFSGPASDSLFV